MQVRELYTYPIKSTRGISIEKTNVLLTGFENDRRIAIVNDKGKIVTGREHPKLLQIEVSIKKNQLIIETGTRLLFDLPIKQNSIEVKLFRKKVLGTEFNTAASDWISSYLKGDYRLIYLKNEFISVDSNRGGLSGDLKTYSDSSPIHLISKATLAHLNNKLNSDVGIQNFRPNIVVDGHQPFEEDNWSILEIDGCQYRVQELTSRCIFTTIDPITSKKDALIEPLATLAKLRLKAGAKPTFGIGLVPLNEGSISVAEKVHILKLKSSENSNRNKLK